MIGERPRRVESKAERLLGRALSDLRYADLGSLIGTGDLHPFLNDLIRRCGEVSVAVQEQYSV
jgi:A predicted alpha-helical domain with a conserved ER motif.